MSGTKLNVEKTEGILLRPLKNSLQYVDGIKTTNNTVKSLGIFLGHDKEAIHEKNWLNKLKEFEKILDSWRIRKLIYKFSYCIQTIESVYSSGKPKY